MLKNIFRKQNPTKTNAITKWYKRTWLFTTTMLRRNILQTTEEYHEEQFEKYIQFWQNWSRYK